ncbi:MAG: nucleoside recognition protein [Verrucomicrobiae bacterium]|nr:nucleoside recognition protein [Verrucomicrobiae bacterium]
MLNWIWLGMITIGILVAALLGRLGGENGIVEQTFDLIKIGVMGIALPLSAMMMLWLGIMRLAEKSGCVAILARLIRPVMRRLFPDVPDDHPAMGAMIMNMAANMLGLGNAATPLGLKAMQHLDELNPHKGTATNAMCTFLAINTSSVTIIPVTAIALLAAQGIANPYAIVSTSLGATICSTLVAIIAVKFFEKLPVFRIAPEATPAPEFPDEEKPTEDALRPFGPKAKIAVLAILVVFAGIVALEWFPDARTRIQDSLGLTDVVAQLNAESADLEEADAGNPGFWLSGVRAVSVVAIPFVLFFFTAFAAIRGVKVYEEFVEGAKEGFQVAVRIMPFLTAMLAALAIVRHSGTLFLLKSWLRPVLDLVHFPPDLLPMALMRPLSGSGSQGVLVELLTNNAITDTLKYTAATMFGSTETTFYVLAVYFGSVAVRRTRHALAAGLCADLAGVIAAVAICRVVFGG